MNALPDPIGVYAILDDGTLPVEVLPDIASEMVRTGVRVLQVRFKTLSSRDGLEWTLRIRDRCPDVCLIQNDRPDLAALAGCDGVHLGDEDLPPAEARRVLRALGSGALLGYSTHSLEEIRSAQENPDLAYLGAGPVFASRTKPTPRPLLGLEGLRRCCSASRLPVVAIGGISLDQVADVRRAGASGVALISALLVPGRVEALARRAVEAFAAAGENP